MPLLLSSSGHPQVEETTLHFLEINFLILLGKYLLHTSYMLGPVLGTWVTGEAQTEPGRANARQEEN